MNKVETFAKFNGKNRRPSRAYHLRACGFELVRTIDPSVGKPQAQAIKYLNEKSSQVGGNYHGVTIQCFNMDRNTFYDLWIKHQ